MPTTTPGAQVLVRDQGEEWSGEPPDQGDPTDHDRDETGTGTTRVTAFLPTEVWERVGVYAKAHRTTKTAALRRAISLLWFVHRRPGAQLLCEYPDGRVERLFFLDDDDHQDVAERSRIKRRR
jgi:hypothetical protein